MEALEILPLGEEHLTAVAEIEALCFSEPWSREALSLLMREGGLGLVACLDGRVVAYGGMTYVLDEGSVTNIATHPDARRRGIGRRLTGAMLDRARSLGLCRVFLEVRESNLAARSLYEGLGFCACGVRKNFYRRPVESAIQMVWESDSL